MRGYVRHHLAVILCSPIPIFIPKNSARDNPNTSANPQHLDLLPVRLGTLPLPQDLPPSPFSLLIWDVLEDGVWVNSGGMDGGDVCEGVVLVSESSDRVKKGSRIPVKLICNTLPRISNPSPIQPTNHTTIENNSIFIFELFNPKT